MSSTSAAESSVDEALRANWRHAVPILLVHSLASLALLSWLFSWTGVILAVLGVYVFGTLGINIGYHRLLTHRGLRCPRWLERVFVLFGVCCAQQSPAFWIAVHRRHHHVADEEPDPHTPRESFIWGHMGWLLIKSENARGAPLIATYAKDIIADPFYAWLENRDRWLAIILASWLMFFVLGYLGGSVSGLTSNESLQLGASLLVWGAFVRTVVVWHITWAVNSVAHRWGYRNYDTPDGSRNNLLIGILSNGEGWHNNHHAYPRSARHGHRAWEVDVAWLTIRLLMKLGLAARVVMPSAH